MTDQEIERLAALIADALLRERARPAAPASRAGEWLPIPVRPELSTRGNEPPIWSGAAQTLDGVAPSIGGAREGARSRRLTTGELTNVVRAAAAGRGVAPQVAPVGRVTHRPNGRSTRTVSIEVGIGVSNRHVHVSPAHARALLGTDAPTMLRAISQPGQFAAAETLTIVGPKGRIERVRIVGPARGETQVEIALSDSRVLGLDVPVAASGALAGSVGGVTLQGPAGSVTLDRGVIVAGRHLHLAASDAAQWGLADGDRLDVRCGEGVRATTFHSVLVRAGKQYATELHLDADEAFAAGVKTGDRARIVATRAREGGRRALITERDVMRLASERGALPANAILTPSARDRARALGLLRES